MTLKSHLDQPNSQLRAFFKERLPNTSGLHKMLKGALGGPVVVDPPRSPSPYRFTEIGHAFGMRATMFFSSEVALIATPLPVGQLSGKCTAAFARDVDKLLARVQPHAQLPERSDEILLCRSCYVLGLFDQMRRVGHRLEMPLMQLPATATPADLLALAPTECVEDVCALVAAAATPLRELPRSPAILGPIFAGSGDLGGADADLILGRTLVEIKTTVDTSMRQPTLQQPVAYALLDYDDKYEIDELAMYSARQASLARVSLQDAVDVMAGTSTDIPALRANLREWMQRDWPPVAEGEGELHPCAYCQKAGVYVPVAWTPGMIVRSRCRKCGERNTILFGP